MANTDLISAAAPATTTAAAAQQKDGICGICPAGCFIQATFEHGEMRTVAPRLNHPLGMICNNGAHSTDIVYDPDRLKHPLRRIGPKGSVEFERISWNEAFDIIEQRFKTIKAESGAEATAIYTGRGSFELSLCDVFQPAGVAVSSASSVLFPFGSPNTLGVGALCYVSFAMIAPHVTFGEMYITLDPDIEQADSIVVWGANPATDSPPTIHRQIIQARERGARVIAIDPRKNETALAVDAEWISIRPGTDGALALSMIQVLIEEELYDEKFVEEWTLGFEELATYTQHFRPEVVEPITGVPAGTIVQLARHLATTRGVSPVMYTGLEYSDSGVQAIRAVFTLWALAGQLDVPGGLLIRMRENQFPINRDGLIPNPNVKKALGRDRFPVYSMYRGESHAIALPDSVLNENPYKIRGLMILGGSIITAWPNPEIWRKTFDALDFLVCVDRYLTADAAYADIVLPATTMYEIDSYMVYGPMFSLREKMLEPIGEARDDFHILTELARRLGYGERYPQNDEERLRHVLKGSGFTLEEVREAGGTVRIQSVMTQYKKWEKRSLREDGKPGFATPSGKFEIASSILADHGYDSLPIYSEPGEGPLAQPELAKRYPLVFNSGARPFADFRSQHHGVAKLNKRALDPRVTLNTEDASVRGISESDWVWVETLRGRVRFRAHVTDRIVRGAIDANMGGGGVLGPEAWQDCNVNDLTDLERYDPISGFPVYKALLCEVVSAGGASSSRGNATYHAQEGPEGGRTTQPAEPAPTLRQVYLDNNASTFVHSSILEAMNPFLTEQGGNPSSVHFHGVRSRSAVEDARRKLAAAINCTARRILFTGGGSEADNLAIKGAALALRARGRHIITSAIEHPAVLGACHGLREFGFETTVLPVGADGRVDASDVETAIREDTVLVSIMMANNELGTIQPVNSIGSLCRRHGVLFHVDAVQALGKIPIDVEEIKADLLAVSAHKLHGPKGVGALFVRKGVELSPLIHGGEQEYGLRAGTENVPGIVGFGKACEFMLRNLNGGALDRVAAMRDDIEFRLLELAGGARVTGGTAPRVPNTTNLVLPGMRGESLVLALDRYGVCFSSGSACKSGNPDPSHVLLAAGLSEDEAHCSIRLSLGIDTTPDDIDYAVTMFEKVMAESESAIRFMGCR